MTKKPILTVAIPAYNVALYIEDTVLSVAKSKYSDNIEILIINDGSTDQTLEIANKLSSNYHCVKVVDKPNGGHGSAINAAIKNASGKYFRLLDGDDWFDTLEFDEYLEKLQNEDADIVFTDLVECFIKSNLNRPVSYYSHLQEYELLALDNTAFPEWGPMLPTSTIKTNLLKKINIKIDENCFYVDQEYNLACYLAAKTAIYYPFMIYQYRLEREGQSMEKTSLIKNVNSHEQVCRRLLSIYQQYSANLTETRKEYIKNKVLIPMCHMQYMIAIEWCKSRKHFLSFDKTLKQYTDIYNNDGVAGTLTNFHRKTKGLFICLDPPIRKLAEKKNTPKPKKISKKQIFGIVLGCIIPLIIVNVIAINYVNSEQAIHFWDTSAYWKRSIELVDTFNQSKFDGFKTISESMNTDYNLLPVLPMVPLLSIFGTSRLSFILIILNLYILPFAIIMTYATKKAFSKKHYSLKPWIYPLIFSVFLLSPAVLIPVFNGRPDAICLIIIALLIALLAKTRMKYISNYVTLGLLTFILILLRRYYCFFAIGLYMSIFIVKTIINYRQFGHSKETIRKTIKLFIKLSISGIIVLILMLIIARNLLIRYLTGNYGDAYSSYLIGDFFNQIILFTKYYGLIFLAIAIIGIIIAFIKYRKTTVSEITTIGLICSIVVFLLFSLIQTLGDQHMYMFVPFMTFSVCIVIVMIHDSKYSFLAILPIIAILSLSIYSFAGTRKAGCSTECYHFFTGAAEGVRPIVRHDIDSINELVNYLENTMSSSDYVYTLSSSFTFNEDVLRNSKLPLYPSFNISNVSHVDKRDGFPSYFFDASYIIVADPIQTHLPNGGQETISYLSNQILRQNVSNLKLIKQFQIDDGINLKLYHKETNYSDAFLRQTKEYFKEKYPNNPILYNTIPTKDLQNL